MPVKPSTVSRDKFTEAQDMAFRADMRLKLVEFVASSIVVDVEKSSRVETSSWEHELLMFAIHEAQDAMGDLHTFRRDGGAVVSVLFSQPIYTAAVGVANLRFFRSPLDGPRLPWHSVEDLYRCLSLPRELRRQLLHRLKVEWKDDVRTVFLKPGQALIAPHFMAQGIIGGGLETGTVPAEIDRAYTMGAADALKVLTEGMGPAEGMNYAIAAYRNENDMDPHFEPLKEYRMPDGRRIIR